MHPRPKMILMSHVPTVRSGPCVSLWRRAHVKRQDHILLISIFVVRRKGFPSFACYERVLNNSDSMRLRVTSPFDFHGARSDVTFSMLSFWSLLFQHGDVTLLHFPEGRLKRRTSSDVQYDDLSGLHGGQILRYAASRSSQLYDRESVN